MTSLLQFKGQVGKRGVNLVFALMTEWRTYRLIGHDVDCKAATATDDFDCPICGKRHPKLWMAWRKPVGTFGHWVVFRYNGEEHVPDLSLPIEVDKLPRGAKPMTIADAAKYWHD